MRQVAFSLAIVALLQGGTYAQPKAQKPCSLLTAELVRKISAGSGQSVNAEPTEISLGASGVGCDWGDIIFQLDPFPPARLDELRKVDAKNWEVISGVGDAAYYHNVRDAMAELYVRVGNRTFGMVVTIPVGSTAAKFKPSVVSVANEIVLKLR